LRIYSFTFFVRWVAPFRGLGCAGNLEFKDSRIQGFKIQVEGLKVEGLKVS